MKSRKQDSNDLPTTREREILQLLDEGLAEKEIAAKLGISHNTVKFHVGNLFTKFGAHKDRELLRKARNAGYLK